MITLIKIEKLISIWSLLIVLPLMANNYSPKTQNSLAEIKNVSDTLPPPTKPPLPKDKK